MTTVRPHTRVVNGRRRPVRAHRRQLRPARARFNARRAYQSARLNRRGAMVAYGTLAAAEIGAWATMRGASFVLVTIGLAVVGAGIAARRATPSDRRIPQRPRSAAGRPTARRQPSR